VKVSSTVLRGEGARKGPALPGLRINMNKHNILHCFIVSALTAIVLSFFMITVSTGRIQSTDMDATTLREHGFDDAAQWSETKAVTRGRVASLLHSFRYPGFWVFWMRGVRFLFVAVLVGTVSVTIWNERRNSQQQNSELSPAAAASGEA